MKSFLSSGIRKYIRARKADIRRRISDPIQRKQLIDDLYHEIGFEAIQKRKAAKRSEQK